MEQQMLKSKGNKKIDVPKCRSRRPKRQNSYSSITKAGKNLHLSLELSKKKSIAKRNQQSNKNSLNKIETNAPKPGSEAPKNRSDSPACYT